MKKIYFILVLVVLYCIGRATEPKVEVNEPKVEVNSHLESTQSAEAKNDKPVMSESERIKKYKEGEILAYSCLILLIFAVICVINSIYKTEKSCGWCGNSFTEGIISLNSHCSKKCAYESGEADEKTREKNRRR